MSVVGVPALSDNYIWVGTLPEAGDVFVVDPGEAQAIIDYVMGNNLVVRDILVTHLHQDHIGGVAALRELFPAARVIGPAEVVGLVAEPLTVVGDGDVFTLGDETVHVLETAGHTLGHISYLVGKQLFCGDALFYAGCGRVFTGDFALAFAGLARLRQLDDAVLVYAGHEYTLTNLRFADSQGLDVAAVRQVVEDRLAAGQPSLPTTIGQERRINPFLRAETVVAFQSLRQQRDHFS